MCHLRPWLQGLPQLFQVLIPAFGFQAHLSSLLFVSRWLHKSIDVVLRPEVLLPATDAAVQDLYSKLGKQLPISFSPVGPVSTS
jgi:hypothetical protein